MESDLNIARKAKMLPIAQVGAKLDIPSEALLQYGSHKAKLSTDFLTSMQSRPDRGKLILVTAITPTPAGEGKTTTTIGLGDALNALGKKTAICLREPSLGPCFGVKGGATGGGFAQVVPMEEINLHFTGDFHAITAANNLLSALIDNHIHWGNALHIDPRKISWKRAIDMNERALRQIVCSLGGAGNGFPREERFQITVASEVMAIFCLANNLQDLEQRLASIVIGETREKTPVTARDLDAPGAMTVLLKDAFSPNLVQTLENNPVFIHGGPFANIAHGCNSVVATSLASKLADYVVTEAGFGADLGAEKFFHIKCRNASLTPSAVVIVATARALKMHGGVGKEALQQENVEAIGKGHENLARHVENMQKFGVPVVVAINRFSTDTHAELSAIEEKTKALGVSVILCDHWNRGSAGAEELAQHVCTLCAEKPSQFRFLYEESLPLWEKVQTIAQQIYGAKEIRATDSVRKQFQQLQDTGYGTFPVCMAKTQYSFSTDPKSKGAPQGHILDIQGVQALAGAGFVIVLAGDILTMPGLPRIPAAKQIGLDPEGRIRGLF